jgi:hypothetical protein
VRRFLARVFLLVIACCAEGSSLLAQQEIESTHYYWKSNPAGESAELLTLFCRACEDGSGSGRDIPLVAVLRDTLSDARHQNDRVTYVWLLTYSKPTWEKRALSAVPFFYWKVGDGSARVGTKDLEPMMNLGGPQRSLVSSTLRNVVQWTVLDPLSMSVR